MPSTAVPSSVSTLLRALEAGDMETIRAAFAPAAAIEDEGETVHGPAGVERWARRVLGYAATFTVEDVTDGAGETVVTTTTAGGFPGSPLLFRWHLTFADGRIASLRIEL